MKSIKSIKSILVFAFIAILSLMFLSNSLAANTAKIVVETANLRENASSDSKILELISKDEEVEVIEKTGQWYLVKHKGISGYINQDLLSVNNTEQNTQEKNETSTTEQTVPEEKTPEEDAKNNESKNYVVVEDSKLKSVPLINATDMLEIKKDTSVKVLQTKNGWNYVESDVAKGWIREEKLKTQEQIDQEEKEAAEAQEAAKAEAEANAPAIKTAYVSSETVNLRKQNSTDSEILSGLVQNTAVEVLSEEDGWSKCRVSGNIGYISTQYLSDTKIEVTSRASTTSRTSAKTEAVAPESDAPVAPSSGNGSSAVSVAMQYIGCSYVYGATGPSSFDCSGFTSYVYRQLGVSLNRTAAGQYSNGVAVSRSNLEPGDLIMFGKSGINHVGIYIGGGQIVHAANASRGVTTDTINSGYYNNNYVGARRVL